MQGIRKISNTWVFDFEKFKMRVSITDQGEIVVFSNDLMKIFGVDCLDYIQQDRFTSYRTDGIIKLLKSPLSIKCNDGKIEEYAYNAMILADFCIPVVSAKENKVLEGEQDEKIFNACKIIVDKLVSQGEEAYKKWQKINICDLN